jgi:GT2 family glycosyltransferase
MTASSEQPTASIVIPTRGRPGYLDVSLASLTPQARAARAEIIVVTDGHEPSSAVVARRHGVRLIELPRQSGANAARNAGVAAGTAELVIFVDDDIEAPDGWLEAFLSGAATAPDRDVFGGPIRARLEGGGPRACGREPAPITTLELGSADHDVKLVWSANMAVRRRALELVGPFDEKLVVCGDEEDWLLRHAARGGRVRYLAAAAVEHRRTAEDSRLRALARSAYARGRAARRYDVYKGTAPPTRRELRTLAGCVWHAVRRRCANGVVLGAQTAGRLREALPVPRS